MAYPIIGVTLDHEEPGGYSKFPWYALRENYANSLLQAKGVPWPLVHDVGMINFFLEHLDGLVITGGAFDISPHLFGHETVHDCVVVKPSRTEFEWKLAEKMLERNKPVFGICGGHQLLNVIFGGDLIQHIPDQGPDVLNHEQPEPRDQAGHMVQVCDGTLLSRIVGSCLSFGVNSAHHQAIDHVGDGLVVNARSCDGLIEGIEHPDYAFCLGIQWHPEFYISLADQNIFSSFVQACLHQKKEGQ